MHACSCASLVQALFLHNTLLQATEDSVECRRMSGAMTNLVFRCDFKGPLADVPTMCKGGPGSAPKPIDAVIVRIEGLQNYDKVMELECFKAGECSLSQGPENLHYSLFPATYAWL